MALSEMVTRITNIVRLEAELAKPRDFAIIVTGGWFRGKK